jgi:hypothetical protein
VVPLTLEQLNAPAQTGSNPAISQAVDRIGVRMRIVSVPAFLA